MIQILPSGTISFLFTDIEGSTRLLQDYPEAMRLAVIRHNELLDQAITANGGVVFKTIGDAYCAAFSTAPAAFAAALAAQLALIDEPWGLPTPIRVRMALHTGNAEVDGSDYFGLPLNRVARIMAAGHGGQVLLSAATQEMVRDQLPNDTSLRDLGEASLKDLSRPEHVFQLLHSSLPSDFPSLRSLDNPTLPNNLPQQPTSFIGRENELAEIKALLANSRLLTLTGASGCGKSRLSLQLAADILEQFPDGVWLVELAAITVPALVPQAVADVLGVREEPRNSIQKTLVHWLKRKNLLLVLDNCEHMIAATSTLVADVMRHCPQVRFIASSLSPLSLMGEQTYRVPCMSLPDPKQVPTIESLSQYEAVRLFIERAQAVTPSFAVTNANAPAVTQICCRLDGIAHAIELAAARVRSLSVEEINSRLDQRFQLLVGGARNVMPRQQTLRAMIDWSYDLLTDSEKRLLQRLSVFAGGWMLTAAEAVCEGEDIGTIEVLDLLTALLDKSLVAAVSREGNTRYRLLETVRQYAGERLEEYGETDAVRNNHLTWCVALAEQAETKMIGADTVWWLKYLETEYDNIRAGFGWNLSSTENAERRLQLAMALRSFWIGWYHGSEGREFLKAALAGEGMERRTPDRARALDLLGILERSNDNEAANSHHMEALALYREIGNREAEAQTLFNLGRVQWDQSNFEAAKSYQEQALVIYRQIGDRSMEADTLNRIGVMRGSEIDEVISYYEQALMIYREIGDRTREASNLYVIATMNELQGDFEGANSCYEQALMIYREIKDISKEADTLHVLGMLKRSRQDWAASRSYHEQALAIHREIGDREREAYDLHQLGVVDREQGDLAQAHSQFAQSLTVRRQNNITWGILGTLASWVRLALAEGDAQSAARLAGAVQAEREAASDAFAFDQQEPDEQTIAAIRTALGDAAFTKEWEIGRGMTLKQAVDYALSA